MSMRATAGKYGPNQKRQANAVAPPPIRPYLKAMPEVVSARTHVSRPLVVAAVLFGAMLAATVALWAHFGTTLFFEMVRAGIAACF